MVCRFSNLKGSYDVAAFEIETNRPVGQVVHESERGGVRYRRLLKRHRPSTNCNVAGA